MVHLTQLTNHNQCVINEKSMLIQIALGSTQVRCKCHGRPRGSTLERRVRFKNPWQFQRSFPKYTGPRFSAYNYTTDCKSRHESHWSPIKLDKEIYKICKTILFPLIFLKMLFSHKNSFFVLT